MVFRDACSPTPLILQNAELNPERESIPLQDVVFQIARIRIFHIPDAAGRQGTRPVVHASILARHYCRRDKRRARRTNEQSGRFGWNWQIFRAELHVIFLPGFAECVDRRLRRFTCVTFRARELCLLGIFRLCRAIPRGKRHHGRKDRNQQKRQYDECHPAEAGRSSDTFRFRHQKRFSSCSFLASCFLHLGRSSPGTPIFRSSKASSGCGAFGFPYSCGVRLPP